VVGQESAIFFFLSEVRVDLGKIAKGVLPSDSRGWV
jgi:hypothetical protein